MYIMQDIFKLLENFILENATKYDVSDNIVLDREGTAPIYEIHRKPKDTEEVAGATIEREITEIKLEYIDDNWTEISISAIDSYFCNTLSGFELKPILFDGTEYFIIQKKNGKINFYLNQG